MEQQIIDFIQDVYQSMSWFGVVLLMAIESACIPLPSEVIMPLAGWMLIEKEGLGIGYLFLAGFCGGLGNVLGSLVAYWVGDKGGMPFLRRYGKYLLITNHDLERVTRWFDNYGDRITFFARFVPGVRTFISFPAGMARMNLVKFCIYAFIGSFIWSLAFAYAGYLLGQNWEDLRNASRPFDYFIVGAGIILVIAFIWVRVRAIRRAK